MEYILNMDKIKSLSRQSGLRSLRALCARANIHQNSLTPYIKRVRSPFTQVVLDIASALNVPALALISTDDDSEISQVKEVVASLIPDQTAIFLFGSRSRGTQRRFSDIDLGITGGRSKLSFSSFSQIKSRIEDAFDNFPLSVNLANLDIAPPDFIQAIEKDLKILCGDEKTANYFLGYIHGRKKD